MAKICKGLSEESAQGTLAKMQETSSAMYTVVTPHLYRSIQLGLAKVIPFFNLFTMFPQSDNKRFFHPVSTTLHLVDVHITDRLRVFLSHTYTFSLIFRDQPFDSPPRYMEGPNQYKDLVIGLSAFEAPTLWPALECFNVNLGQEPGVLEREYDKRDLNPEAFEPLFEAICAKSHHRNMVVRFPSPPALIRHDHYATWESSLRRLSAEYIDCIDYNPKGETIIPRASSSLTLRFHPQAVIKSAWRIDAKVARICWERDGLCDVKRIELVGIILPHSVGPINIYDEPEATTSLVFDSISEHIGDLMAWRLREGNSEDLQITIIPDTSPTSRAEAVWHTYKVPQNQ